MKNKYKLLFVFALVGFLFITSVNAKEITLDNLDEVIADKYSEEKESISYLYIIGDYAFSSEHNLTIQDIGYAFRHSKHNVGDGYDGIVIYYLRRTSNENDEWTGWVEEPAVVGKGTLIDSSKKFNLTYIDSNDLEDRTPINSDTNIKNYIKGLNGKEFFTKEYDETNGTLTINLAKENLNFEGISGTNAINGIVDLIKLSGYESIDLTYGENKVTIEKTDNDTSKVMNKLSQLLTKVKEKNAITDISIDIKFNLVEMYKESGSHNSKYTIKFTSIVDLDKQLNDLMTSSKASLSTNHLSMNLDGNNINVVIEEQADAQISSINNTGLIAALVELILDPRVQQINVGNVVVSSNSNALTVKQELTNALGGGSAKIGDLAGKTITIKVDLKEGLGVLDNKATNTTNVSRTYTIKFSKRITADSDVQDTKTSVEDIIDNLFGSKATSKKSSSESGKNVYIIDIVNPNAQVQTTLESKITSALSYYESVEVTINNKTYILKTEDTSVKEELTTLLKDKKLSTFSGNDITIKYNLKEDTLDKEYDLDDDSKLILNNGYTEYILKVRSDYINTDETVIKAITDSNNKLTAASSYADSVIGMNFDEKNHVITFELKHPMVSVKDLTDKIKTGFNTALQKLLNVGSYTSIVVNFGGTEYTLKLDQDKKLENGLESLLTSIESRTLYQIKDNDINVTFNLNDGVMDEVYGDTKAISYKIKLSDEVNVAEALNNVIEVQKADTTSSARIIFNEETKEYYLLYSDTTKKLSDLNVLIGTTILGTKGTIKNLFKDERVSNVIVTIGNKDMTITDSTAWGTNASGLRKEFDDALNELVKTAIEGYNNKIADVTLAQLQNVINENALLKIKVNLKNGYAVSEEDGTTSYEYVMKLSRYANTVDRVNNIKVAGSKLSSSFSTEKKEIDFKVSDGNIEFLSDGSGSTIYKSLNSGSYGSVSIEGKKSDSEIATNLITLTKDNVTSETFDDADNKLLFAIKDLIGIEKDASKLTDLIGYDIIIKVNMADGYLSENGNKVETYTIHFVANE